MISSEAASEWTSVLPLNACIEAAVKGIEFAVSGALDSLDDDVLLRLSKSILDIHAMGRDIGGDLLEKLLLILMERNANLESEKDAQFWKKTWQLCLQQRLPLTPDLRCKILCSFPSCFQMELLRCFASDNAESHLIQACKMFPELFQLVCLTCEAFIVDTKDPKCCVFVQRFLANFQDVSHLNLYPLKVRPFVIMLQSLPYLDPAGSASSISMFCDMAPAHLFVGSDFASWLRIIFLQYPDGYAQCIAHAKFAFVLRALRAASPSHMKNELFQ
ncbi:unnamed protein product [Darwinula stevensoni]|uniref:Uncharacterized protein n=1 Tax=Darwinula stevensoni TaxID=69355 RepID=A0A7R9A9S9_9CRUS|nr:unnamed protein product [Darwinula stevensoni]CAG0897607.1 unnamed protein product [Darwinula stevensoni]